MIIATIPSLNSPEILSQLEMKKAAKKNKTLLVKIMRLILGLLCMYNYLKLEKFNKDTLIHSFY